MRLSSVLALLIASTCVVAEDRSTVAGLLAETAASPHTEQIDASRVEVVDHRIGLGPIQKVLGRWEFEESERHDGTLARYTWQVKDGFAAAEVLARLEQDLLALDGAELLFTCEGRSCGRANEWANRVFNQRLLYGKSDEQRYSVIAVEDTAGTARVLLYSSARTVDRQYLHADYLLLDSD